MKFTPYRRLLRAEQWYKNILIFLPLTFAPLELQYSILQYALGFLGFCLISSVTYIINDWVDREKDRMHPTKKDRPLAAGTVTGMQACAVVGTLVLVEILINLQLGIFYSGVVWIYFVLTNCYSYGLKNIPIVDIILISLNFLLRTLAGVKNFPDSNTWPYFLMVFSVIVIFLSHKRRSDIKFLGEKALAHKPVLQFYTPLRSYIIRLLGYAAFGIISYLLWNAGTSPWFLIALLITMITTSIVFSREPLLVMKPHKLFRVWWWDVIVLGLVLGVSFKELM